MKLKSLLSKFHRKKRDNNNSNSNDNDKKKQNQNQKKNQRQRRNKRGHILSLGSPSSSRTRKTNSYCEDDDSEGLYHPEYVPPSTALNFEVAVVGEEDRHSLTDPGGYEKHQQQALNESLYSQDVVGEKDYDDDDDDEADSPRRTTTNNKMRSIHNGVASEMVWMNAALLDDYFSSEEEEEEENIHSSEYLSAAAAAADDDSNYLFYLPEKSRGIISPSLPLRPTISLTSLALDSTRASSMYRTYESDFDDFGLVTDAVVVDDELVGEFKSDDVVLGDLPQQPPSPPLNKSTDYSTATIPAHSNNKGPLTPVRWSSQVSDMTRPPPPPPEPDFPMDELYDDLRVLILDDDVSALSNDTPPPPVYRNMQRELRRSKSRHPPVTSSSTPSFLPSKCEPNTTSWSSTCQRPSFLLLLQHDDDDDDDSSSNSGSKSTPTGGQEEEKQSEDDDDNEKNNGKLRVAADMFHKVFRCQSSSNAGTNTTTAMMSRRRSGGGAGSMMITMPRHYEIMEECVEA